MCDICKNTEGYVLWYVCFRYILWDLLFCTVCTIIDMQGSNRKRAYLLSSLKKQLVWAEHVGPASVFVCMRAK